MVRWHESMRFCEVTTAESSRRISLPTSMRPCERVLLVYLVYVAVRSVWLPTTRPVALAACILAGLAVIALSHAEVRRPRLWSSVARHWALVAIILPGYWALEFISGQPLDMLQSTWLAWDRHLLDGWGLRTLIEAGGSVGPWLLESAYLFLYAIPPLSLALVYAFAGRRLADRFLLVLLLGTLSAYALIPLVPVISPRIAYPGMDEPAIATVPRAINVWMLDHLDNAVTVFPSGHVAVAFSSAFGLLTVFRRRAVFWLPAFALAALIYVATIYGRYHYLVDGLTSIVVATATWRLVAGRSDRAA